MALSTPVFTGFQISDENSVFITTVDQVVTGNYKEMCYEGVHWIGVAHDQM